MSAPAASRVTTTSGGSAAPSTDERDKTIDDAVERPALVWWLLVLGGLSILGLQSWSAPFYLWWTRHVNWLPSQAVMAWVFIACIPIHLGEAIYVYAAAPRNGLVRTRTAWALQTLVLGYPSTHLFRKRAALRRPSLS